ncbi:PPK2 family polyphosphate kinase [uncultured Subdoligranulum sp.]|uniref:PPK2 family polyphosphate kinase n=1 Tax=uncultured Subdoligranulum sp. TaxID=512298 RepID=UPI0025E7DF34|nr:PPK2 family polyphosphate kinase [uncultured Subdoligranulum sp.]
MKADRYRFDGSHPCDLRALPCDGKQDDLDKEKILAKTARNLEEMAALQDALYADGREGLIFVLQALDAAGKDSTIKHVMSGLNPQGVRVTSFKQPNSEELSHDFLWRVHKALPPRGSIAIFNRSYYEDVLVVQVHDLQKTYKMPPRTLEGSKKEFFQKRYRQIRHYEQYLYDNGYRIVKIFLHVSKEEQKKRFLQRIDNPAKNWKFSLSDVKERAHFAEYLDTFQEVIDATATPESPWYALPADQKWYTRYLVSEIVVDSLRQCCHQYPRLREDALAELKDCRTQLEAED